MKHGLPSRKTPKSPIQLPSIGRESAGMMRPVTLTDSKYATAWHALKHRYENKRLTINENFDHLMSVPNMKYESVVAIKRLAIDGTLKTFRAL